jgi:hypothetical protein
METREMMEKLNELPSDPGPPDQRMLIAEKIIHSVRKEETKSQLKLAAESLCSDYKNDYVLTIFSQLDGEDLADFQSDETRLSPDILTLKG